MTRPGEYDCGCDPPDGGRGWDLFGEIYPSNPKCHLLDNDWEALRAVIRLWRYATNGILPDAGGVNDQPAILLDAFAVLSAAEAALRLSRDEFAGRSKVARHEEA